MACLAQLLEIKDLSADEINTLTDHCFRGFVAKNGHYAFLGKEGSDYSRTSFHIRGVKYSIRRHQLALYLKLKQSGSSTESWNKVHSINRGAV